MYYEGYKDPNEERREIEINSRKFKVSSLWRVQLPNGSISQGSLDAGYLRIFREKYYVHRLVALAFFPKKEGKEYVNHMRLGLGFQRRFSIMVLLENFHP
jgi:hypothetical protein